MTKLKIKKGDTVKLIAGDDKGKSGIIKSVDLKKMRVLVEGVNMVKRHTKKVELLRKKHQSM
jgi:large subunit ribosomal protein L24